MIKIDNKITRRNFNYALASTVILSTTPYVSPSFSALEPSNNEGNVLENELLIVTARSIFSEPRVRKFEHKSNLTGNPFNVVYNKINFNQSDRYVINQRVKEEVENSGDTLNILVHGFNTGWNESIHLAESLYTKLGEREGHYDILYNWPTETVNIPEPKRWVLSPVKHAAKLPLALIQEYLRSVDQINGAADKLSNFLEFLLEEFPQKKINLIAHSMGGKIALQAIHTLSRVKGKSAENAISQLILASPDIAYEEFNRLFAKARDVCGRTTLYSSPRDIALYLSNRARDNVLLDDKLRIGVPELQLNLINRKYIDYLMYSGGLFEINHTFFIEEDCILNDIQELLSLERHRPKRIQDRSIKSKLRKLSLSHENAYILK